jgi:hypothetical protein
VDNCEGASKNQTTACDTALGVAAGYAVAPGLGGWFAGGLIGSAFVEDKKMNKTRVFVSFEKVI